MPMADESQQTPPANGSGTCQSPAVQTSTWAITALALSLLACTGLGAIGALICSGKAWSEIGSSHGKLKGRLLVLIAVGITIFELAGMLLPASSAAWTKGDAGNRMNYAAVHALAVIEAAKANGERFPNATNWEEQSAPFRIWGFRGNSMPASLLKQTNRLGLNSAIAGKRLDEVASNAVLVFELQSPAANASGGPELMGKPENGYARGVAVGFVDGHAELISPKRLDNLRWAP